MRSFAAFYLVIVLFIGNASAQSADSSKTNGSAEPAAPAADSGKQPAPKRIRVNQGVLKPIHRVDPTYPESAPMKGTVSLSVVIATDGSVRNLQLISGDDRLALSAIEAVKQWRYKPLSVNGSPVEVETQIDVKFSQH